MAPILARFGDDVQRVELETNPTPDHHVMLSLYARPHDARTPDQYATGLAPLAKAVVPALLARYPGLYAVDLCQEAQHPPADVAEPPPLTRVTSPGRRLRSTGTSWTCPPSAARLTARTRRSRSTSTRSWPGRRRSAPRSPRPDCGAAQPRSGSTSGHQGDGRSTQNG